MFQNLKRGCESLLGTVIHELILLVLKFVMHHVAPCHCQDAFLVMILKGETVTFWVRGIR